MSNNIKIVVNGKDFTNGELNHSFNSTEVDIYEDGILQSEKRIGGTNFRTLENIGKVFEGIKDGLGFHRIANSN